MRGPLVRKKEGGKKKEGMRLAMETEDRGRWEAGCQVGLVRD